MNGAEVFSFALRTVPPAVEELLQKSGLTLDQVDFFILHQANKFILERLRGKMKIPPEKFWIEMENCGNTVSSTIPISLHGALWPQPSKPPDRVALVRF